MTIHKTDSKIQRHMRICAHLTNGYRDELLENGGLFGEHLKKYGMTAACIRLDESMRLLENIRTQPDNKRAEEVEHALHCLADTAIAALVELECAQEGRRRRNEQKEDKA